MVDEAEARVLELSGCMGWESDVWILVEVLLGEGWLRVGGLLGD